MFVRINVRIGFEMSGKDAHRFIGFSTVLYVLFAFVLAATCTREALLTDYIIAERVAATGEWC